MVVDCLSVSYLGVVNSKSESCQDAVTLLINVFYCKMFKNPRIKETHNNETSGLITNAIL